MALPLSLGAHMYPQNDVGFERLTFTLVFDDDLMGWTRLVEASW